MRRSFFFGRKVGKDMVKELVKDQFFLRLKSQPITKEDKQILIDLKDTLNAYAPECVGMSANMIGVNKAVIAIKSENDTEVKLMLNPKIIKKSGAYETEEGCMCLEGERKATRHMSITVEYFDENFKKHIEMFAGYLAEIIEHECDHLEGILI